MANLEKKYFKCVFFEFRLIFWKFLLNFHTLISEATDSKRKSVRSEANQV
jgi:hypothetical protein